MKVDSMDDVPDDIRPLVEWMQDRREEFDADEVTLEPRDDVIEVTFTFSKEKFTDE